MQLNLNSRKFKKKFIKDLGAIISSECVLFLCMCSLELYISTHISTKTNIVDLNFLI